MRSCYRRLLLTIADCYADRIHYASPPRYIIATAAISTLCQFPLNFNYITTQTTARFNNWLIDELMNWWIDELMNWELTTLLILFRFLLGLIMTCYRLLSSCTGNGVQLFATCPPVPRVTPPQPPRLHWDSVAVCNKRQRPLPPPPNRGYWHFSIDLQIHNRRCRRQWIRYITTLPAGNWPEAGANSANSANSGWFFAGSFCLFKDNVIKFVRKSSQDNK